MSTTIAMPQPRIIEALDIHVGITSWNERVGLDIRQYYEESNPPHEMKPGRKGIRLPIQYVPELIAHLSILQNEAEVAGLLESEDE